MEREGREYKFNQSKTREENKKIKSMVNPGGVVQLVGASSQYTEVVGSIPGQGTYKNQTNECINKWNNKQMFLSLSPPLSLKSINLKKN